MHCTSSFFFFLNWFLFILKLMFSPVFLYKSKHLVFNWSLFLFWESFKKENVNACERAIYWLVYSWKGRLIKKIGFKVYFVCKLQAVNLNNGGEEIWVGLVETYSNLHNMGGLQHFAIKSPTQTLFLYVTHIYIYIYIYICYI